MLTPQEAKERRALPNHRQADRLAGRAALKGAYLLHRGEGFERADVIAVAAAPDGGPQLVGAEELHCSLSHSFGWGVGAVSSGPVGVDVERVLPRSPSLATHIADEDEFEIMYVPEERLDALIARVWTVKEAALKALGVGLAGLPRGVRILSRDGSRVAVETASAVPDTAPTLAAACRPRVLRDGRSGSAMDASAGTSPRRAGADEPCPHSRFWTAYTYSVDDHCIAVVTALALPEQPRLRWFVPPGVLAAERSEYARRA